MRTAKHETLQLAGNGRIALQSVIGVGEASRPGAVADGAPRRQDTFRLLLILTEFPPSFGGMQTHAIHLCRYLHQRGYHAEVATYRGPQVEFPFPVHRCLSRIGFTENLRILEGLTRAVRPDLLYASTIFYGRLSASTGIPMIARSAGNDVLRPWIVWPYRRLSRLLSTPSIEDILYRRFRKLDWPEGIESLLLTRRKAEMALSARPSRACWPTATIPRGCCGNSP